MLSLYENGYRDGSSAEMFDILIESVGCQIAEISDMTIYSEKTEESFITKIKRAIAKLISGFMTFFSSFKTEINEKVASIEYSAAIKKQRKLYLESKANGIKTVEISDIEEVKNVYKSAIKDLTKKSKNFTKYGYYQSTLQLNNDIEAFNKSCDKWEVKIEKSTKKQKKVSIDTAIGMLEKEITHTTNIYAETQEYIKEMENMKRTVDRLTIEKEMIGAEMLPSHLNAIQRLILKITKTIRKWIAKIIARFLFFWRF